MLVIKLISVIGVGIIAKLGIDRLYFSKEIKDIK